MLQLLHAYLQCRDARSQKNESNLMNEHVGVTSSLVFSENGYLLASGDSGGRLRLWDLRKLKATKGFDCKLLYLSLLTILGLTIL